MISADNVMPDDGDQFDSFLNSYSSENQLIEKELEVKMSNRFSRLSHSRQLQFSMIERFIEFDDRMDSFESLRVTGKCFKV